jgi:tight adherence protein C
MDLQLLLPMLAVFAAVASAAAALFFFLSDPQVARQRLARVAAQPGTATAPRESLVDTGDTPLAKQVRSFVPKSPKEMNRIARLMAGAGYHSPWATLLFVIAQLGLPVVLFIASVTTLGTGRNLLFAVFAGAVGYFIPTLWLGRLIERRRKEIRNGLPDAIDLMIVCIEAGSGIDQALSKVAEELTLSYPPLARELEMITMETRAGKPRMEAFKNFAERTKVDDVRSLVAMLVQTDRFGTSIGQALRTHAEVSRTKRRQRGEEKAAKLGVKLLFPLIFCLFPAFYVIVLGPSMVRMYRNFIGG